MSDASLTTAAGAFVALVLAYQFKKLIVRMLLIGCLALLVLHLRQGKRSGTLRMHIVDIGDANEALVLKGFVAGRSSFFQIDTGYAGPPVLSSTYLTLDGVERTRIDALPSVAEQYAATISAIHSNASDERRNAAIDGFLRTGGCFSYTSGCTMRLMGIGSIVEQQADMFLCDPLEFYNVDGALVSPKRAMHRSRGDVLVTNPLPASAHIITMDFMLHLSPCVLLMRQQALEFSVSPPRAAALRGSFRFLPLETAGGSPVIDVDVGGATFKCTMDTGAPGSVSLGRQAADRITSCKSVEKSVVQRGVNGETICSTIVTSDVAVAGVRVRDADVFVNDTPVDHTDGYVGMGFLRALDIMITPSGIGFRPSGLAPKRHDEYPTTSGACKNAPHTENWKDFFDGADRSSYSVYAHIKSATRKTQPWLKNAAIKTVATDWCGIGLVHAHVALLRQALLDVQNEHFALVSQACVPTMMLYEMQKRIHKDPRTRMYFPPVNAPGYMLKGHKSMRAHHSWWLLNRDDAQYICDTMTAAWIRKEEARIHALDVETWYWCFDEYLIGLALRGRHGEVGSSGFNRHISNRPPTFAHFPTHTAPHPTVWRGVDVVRGDVWKRIVRKGCFFARKFNASGAAHVRRLARRDA